MKFVAKYLLAVLLVLGFVSIAVGGIAAVAFGFVFYMLVPFAQLVHPYVNDEYIRTFVIIFIVCFGLWMLAVAANEVRKEFINKWWR